MISSTARRAAHPLSWMVTAMMGLVALTQAVGITPLPTIYVAQALTPFVLAPAVPIAIGACRANLHRLALTNVGIASCLLWLSVPLIFPADLPTASPGSPRLSVAHGNVYYGNATPDAAVAALLNLGADVVAITEYSSQIDAALANADSMDRYPFQRARSSGNRDDVALLSRYPILSTDIAPIGNQYGIEATLDVDGVEVRVIIVHPLPGTSRSTLAGWSSDLDAIGDLASRPGPPTVIVGDFNASRWHPAMRRLLDRGFVDVHESLDRGWSTSWPNDMPGPAFVRIDHALTGDGLVAETVDDVALPGSDHIGFVVSIALTNAP